MKHVGGGECNYSKYNMKCSVHKMWVNENLFKGSLNAVGIRSGIVQQKFKYETFLQ